MNILRVMFYKYTDIDWNLFLFVWSRFFSVLTSLMAHKYKEVYVAAAKVLGLALAYMESNMHVRDRSLSLMSGTKSLITCRLVKTT